MAYLLGVGCHLAGSQFYPAGRLLLMSAPRGVIASGFLLKGEFCIWYKDAQVHGILKLQDERQDG